jgi:hypothetical protein
MYLIRYVMTRLFVFWLSIIILVYGWFNNAKLVNASFGASETLVKNLTGLDQTGRDRNGGRTHPACGGPRG